MPKPDTRDNNGPEKGGEVEALRPYERMVKQLQGIAKLEADSGAGFDIAANVIDKMLTVDLNGEDFDSFIDGVLEAGSDGPLKAEDMEHKPFQVREIQWFKSAEAFATGGFGTYAVVKATNPVTFEDLIFSVGATNVVGTLFAFDQRGVFESDKNPLLVIRSRPTPNGRLFYLARA
jgi:hypothetical protein